jgi:two-component system sensor histidine kinase KdpD
MVYLAGVAFVAARHGRGPSALAALLSVAAFDFFFVPPRLTFAVGDTQYIVTFGVMLVVSLLISTLAVRVRAQAESARQREQRTQVLYAMSRGLAAARTADEVARVASRHVSEVFRGPATVRVPGADGRLARADGAETSADSRDNGVAQWAFEHKRIAGLGTDTLPGASAVYVPLHGAESTLGVLGVRPDAALLPLSPDQMDLLEALARQAASGLERTRLAEQAGQARLAAETERLRSTLLSSVSHDLRTPLASITGAASSLLDAGAELPPEARRELLETVHEEAGRLNRLVANLLDMTRLEAGALHVRKEWLPIEEIVGAALTRMEPRLRGRQLQTRLPPELPLVPVDDVLIEQVLVNLLENAVKYTPNDTPIEVSASADTRELTVEVADRGPGLPPGEEERVFEKFRRLEARGRQGGVGLGLAICRGIVAAHGGRTWADNRAGGGAVFRFTLPLEGTPPTVAAETLPTGPS